MYTDVNRESIPFQTLCGTTVSSYAQQVQAKPEVNYRTQTELILSRKRVSEQRKHHPINKRLVSWMLETTLLQKMTVAKLCYSISTAIPVFWSQCRPQDLHTQSCPFFPHCRYCYPQQTADGWMICPWSKFPGLSLWNMLFWVPVLHNQTLHVNKKSRTKK